MPDKIIFALSGYYLESIKPHWDIPEQKISAQGASVLLTDITGCPNILNNNLADKSIYAQTLFVTDDPEVFQQLFREGLYVIALYHENNRNCNFQEASYAVEDILQLEYRSYAEAYRRLAGLPWDILETERLYVRESTAGDIPDFYRIYQNPAVADHMEPLFENPEEERAYLQDYIKQVYGFYGFGIWTVILKSTGQIIGRAGLNIREGYEFPELGFVIDGAYQNQGIAFEVCSAILTYAKEELFLDQIQAFVQEENIPSRKLLEKLGFTYNRTVFENNREYLQMLFA